MPTELSVLPECQQGVSELRYDIHNIERDLVHQTKLLDKLTEVMEKIQTNNSHLCAMIQVHELKHTTTEKLHDALGEDMDRLASKVDLLQPHPELHHPSKAPREPRSLTPDDRLQKLEQWKWMIIGGAITAGWLLSHLNGPILSLFQYIIGK